MNVIQGQSIASAVLRAYELVYRGGEEVEQRGQITKNVMNMAIVMPAQPILTSFQARKFSLAYAKQEWLWYLRADPFDATIEQYATMWKKLRQPDGRYFSNYGQYIFAGGRMSQFWFVVNTLLNDMHSRRASMVLLNKEHLFHENTDMVCTYAINFTIEHGKLHMTVMMRSNDIIFGFTNDAFCFSQLYEFVYQMLIRRYAFLERGLYTHFANSMHVYQRHFEMINQIIEEGLNGYQDIDVPQVTSDEVERIVDFNTYGGTGAYSDWLKA